MILSALTNGELEGILDALDALSAAYDLLITAGAVRDGVEYDAGEIADAVAAELEQRETEDAAFREAR